MGAEASTMLIDSSDRLASLQAPTFTVEVVEGPDRGTSATAVDGCLSVGTAERVGLRLSDPTVSRFHAELEATADGIALHDLGSTNGTLLGSVAVREVVLRAETEICFGQTRTRLTFGGRHRKVETSARTSFGSMMGSCPQIRRVFMLLERAAPTTAPVLISGESGTGKELAARAVHDASPRRDEAFEIVDCGSLPPTLIESELFGHVTGAFTGATHDREGAFERAEGGTLFLDELGELPLELQPKLLRALGEHQIRRVGGRDVRTVDVRVVAATNRDLRREVNAGRFRADLYYRLAVIHVQLPPLRDRAEDLPLLVRSLLEQIAAERGIDAHIEPDSQLLGALSRHRWPGNIRELRNYLEQLVILRIPPPLPSEPGAADSARAAQAAPAAHPGSTESPAAADPLQPADSSTLGFAELQRLPLRLAKNQLLERFERRYLERLLDETDGNVAAAARQAGVDRGTLFRTIRRYGLKVSR